MTFAPYPHRSGFIFLGLAVIFGGLAAILIARFPAPDNWLAIFQITIALLVSLVLLALALYWTITAFKFTYHLNRNGVIIRWGLTQKLIPFNSIKTIIPGQNLPPIPKFRGLNIAGLQFGWAELSDYGPIEIHATAGQADSLLIVTPNRSYLVSPRSPDTFLEAWQVRQRLGPTQHWTAGIRRSWPLNLPVLSDPLTWWLLGLALLTYLFLLGYLSLIFAGLPQLIPIHYDAFGQADRIADKSALLILPTVGAIVLGLNSLLGALIYRWERLAAYLLWGGAIVMQGSLWVALLTVT